MNPGLAAWIAKNKKGKSAVKSAVKGKKVNPFAKKSGK